MRFPKKKYIIITLVTLVTVTGAGAGCLAYASYNSANAALEEATTSGSVVDLLNPESLNGEETGTVNLLIAGNSVDDAGHDGAELTDSILVANYSLETQKLALISIPRDLWVTANGASMKINAVYTVGGMDLLESTVEDITGLTINHQVLISYNAVASVVDALGGIDITIASTDSRGIYDPMIGLTLTNGTHHMDGQQVLLLARSRNDPTYDGRIAYGLPNGDFDRMANQRMIATTILDKVASSETLTNVATLKSLIESVSGAVHTDLSVGQLRRLYDLSKDVTATTSLSIRGDNDAILLRDYIGTGGQSALIPATGIGMYEVIRQYVNTHVITVTEEEDQASS